MLCRSWRTARLFGVASQAANWHPSLAVRVRTVSRLSEWPAFLYGKTVGRPSGGPTASLLLCARHGMRTFACSTQIAESFTGARSVGATVDVVVARLVAHLVYWLPSLRLYYFESHGSGGEVQKKSGWLFVEEVSCGSGVICPGGRR